MKLQPLEASLFDLLPEDQKQSLVESGLLPVNDVFLPIWTNQSKIILLYGSYGSGKSIFVVDALIDKCMNDSYFRCYFGRKVLDNVRGTVFQTITDRIKELGREDEFDFSEKPNGTMVISHKTNSNKFLPFGANDAQSLKSIKDPTHFFCEELDQFSFEDFGFIYSRLRTKKAITQLFGAFNTERIYQSHWIRKVLFDGEFKDQALRVKANYNDNYFIDHEDYLSKLKLIANGNIAVLNAIANGEWGMIRTGSEFWKSFDETKHVKEVRAKLDTTIHVSCDENVNPYVTQTIWQIFPQTKKIHQVHEILSKSPKNNAPKAAKELVDWLNLIGYSDVVYVYGDPSAGKRSTVDENNASFYDKFIEVLRIAGFSVVKRVGRSAPQVALSAAFINSIYESNLNGWEINISDRCFTSIEDYMVVKEDSDGTMLKKTEKDKDTGVTFEPQGHVSDSKRYFLTTILATEFAVYKARGKRVGSIAVPRG